MAWASEGLKWVFFKVNLKRSLLRLLERYVIQERCVSSDQPVVKCGIPVPWASSKKLYCRMLRRILIQEAVLQTEHYPIGSTCPRSCCRSCTAEGALQMAVLQFVILQKCSPLVYASIEADSIGGGACEGNLPS